MKSTSLALTAIGLLLCALPAAAQNADHGARGYKLCASCHGFRGEGNRLVNAPALAGREAWYLQRQLVNFRDGIRGHAEDDAAGQTMAAMTRGLESDEEILDIVAYIGTMAAADPPKTIEGNVNAGRSAYATCTACHGADGKGNEALSAPGLAAIDDWYQLAQLEKFKAGQRGEMAADTYGRQMAPMAKMLANQQAMKDVVAYIATLD